MRSWRPFFFAVLVVVACSDDTQKPLLTSQSGTGQPGWQWSNPHPQGNDLNEVDFFDSKTGFAVGNFGAIVRTTDGGVNWELQKSGTTDFLFGVAANGAQGAVAVGANGIILRTINRGATWERRQSGVSAGLQDVDFADANHGLVVGENAILRTTDAGATWTPADLSSLPHDDEGRAGFNAVSMVDANIAFALGRFGLYATSDGGATWAQRSEIGGHDVYFTDAKVGTVVGSGGSVFRTEDGGTTWFRQRGGEPSLDFNSVDFFDADHGLIAGFSPEPFRPSRLYTSDGGDTWTYQDPQIPGYGVLTDFKGAALPDVNTGVVVGVAGNIFRTIDAGVTWENTTRFTAIRVPGIAFANANDGVAVGVATVLRTRDGGVTWDRYNPGPFFLYGVCYFGANGVVAVGFDNHGALVLRSTDSGSQWTTIPIGGAPRAIDSGNELTGNAVGPGGSMLRTIDAGHTWTAQESGTTEELDDVAMLNQNNGIAVGANGTLLRTTDGGAFWQNLAQPGVTGYLSGVDFADSETGFVVGRENTILRTTDGGATWVKQDSGTEAIFVDVACADRNSAAALALFRGTPAQVLITTDGGNHWMLSESLGTHLRPIALCIAGKKTVTVSGDFGMILQNHHIFP